MIMIYSIDQKRSDADVVHVERQVGRMIGNADVQNTGYWAAAAIQMQSTGRNEDLPLRLVCKARTLHLANMGHMDLAGLRPWDLESFAVQDSAHQQSFDRIVDSEIAGSGQEAVLTSSPSAA